MAWFWVVVASGVSVSLLVLRRIVNSAKICPSKAMMTGKTVVITGANCGIGKSTASELAKRNARVILACRDVGKATKAVNEIRRRTQGGELVVKYLDLASVVSIQKFADSLQKEEQRLDVLINNAGVFQCPYTKTKDGFEMQMGVNHIGHFLLTNLLTDMLKKSAPSRVVVVTSSLHKRGTIDFDDLQSERFYSKSKSYANSKLANVHFSRELSRQLYGSNVSVYCVHPGMVMSNVSRHVVPGFIKSLLTPLALLLGARTNFEGCQTVLYCSVAEEVANETGKYYGNCKMEPWHQASNDDGVAKKLWEVSEKLTKLA
ncbi:retinol dehydrogenase 14-like [Haliotis rufescens]|uniref:retinol dehydrogenase 14-like n=1 Tax=Haliotis rufescens TaxID=6454 RepID=UPI00201E8947|nr:retinol dehydrogenase 14-like [Haliotis rufescens]